MTYTFNYQPAIQNPSKSKLIAFIDYVFIEHQVIDNTIHLPRVADAQKVQLVEYQTNEEKIQILEKFSLLQANKKLHAQIEELDREKEAIQTNYRTLEKLKILEEDYRTLEKELKKQFDKLIELKNIVSSMIHTLEANKNKYKIEIDSLFDVVSKQIEEKSEDIREFFKSIHVEKLEAIEVLAQMRDVANASREDFKKDMNSLEKKHKELSNQLETEKLKAVEHIQRVYIKSTKDIEEKVRRKLDDIHSVNSTPKQLVLRDSKNKNKYKVEIENGKLNIKEVK